MNQFRPYQQAAVDAIRSGAGEASWPVGTGQSVAVEHAGLSNNQRRLLGAVTDLPEPWKGVRQDRTEGEALGRHLASLRTRLDWLVRVEEEHGDDQKAKGWNRAERNALIRVLQDYAEEAGLAAAKPRQPGQKYDQEYIDDMHEKAAAAIALGYTVCGIHGPGILMHCDVSKPDMHVPMPVWFFVRGYLRGLEQA